MLEKIMLENGKKLQPNKFLPFGTAPDRDTFFAVVDKDLYCKRGDYYSLLKEKYLQPGSNRLETVN